MHSTWEMSDCIRFHELLAKKEFCGVVVEISEDNVVSMILYDTVVEPPIDIGAVLVEEGRATDMTSSLH